MEGWAEAGAEEVVALVWCHQLEWIDVRIDCLYPATQIDDDYDSIFITTFI